MISFARGHQKEINKHTHQRILPNAAQRASQSKSKQQLSRVKSKKKRGRVMTDSKRTIAMLPLFLKWQVISLGSASHGVGDEIKPCNAQSTESSRQTTKLKKIKK